LLAAVLLSGCDSAQPAGYETRLVAESAFDWTSGSIVRTEFPASALVARGASGGLANVYLRGDEAGNLWGGPSTLLRLGGRGAPVRIVGPGPGPASVVAVGDAYWMYAGAGVSILHADDTQTQASFFDPDLRHYERWSQVAPLGDRVALYGEGGVWFADLAGRVSSPAAWVDADGAWIAGSPDGYLLLVTSTWDGGCGACETDADCNAPATCRASGPGTYCATDDWGCGPSSTAFHAALIGPGETVPGVATLVAGQVDSAPRQVLPCGHSCWSILIGDRWLDARRIDAELAMTERTLPVLAAVGSTPVAWTGAHYLFVDGRLSESDSVSDSFVAMDEQGTLLPWLAIVGDVGKGSPRTLVPVDDHRFWVVHSTPEGAVLIRDLSLPK